ncbi:hypothetical protein EST38_g6158 [Candolleomyces aberdarensis]|uniref:Uncharacterized protein n=1 Tax=Candolleomyces aberdarensis TaxID=2316362 RepID=A0A4Q2DIH1_9AGAR|nr:hypothetical protein EST38_g6158 [Candolleomyces aberdarensis]
MILLGIPQNARGFPHLSIEDTRRSSPTVKRALGDSRRFDGALWTAAATIPPLNTSKLTQLSPSTCFDAPDFDVGTQGIAGTRKRKADDTVECSRTALSPSPSSQGTTNVMNIEDGWIWRLGGIGNISEKEMEEWEEEGDRVHWFRAEAEMERWREQWEVKLVEFLRCIRSFDTMSQTWTTLATRQSSSSYAAFARKKALMYKQMAGDVQTAFRGIQLKEPTIYSPGENIVQFIVRHRRVELSQFHQKHVPRLLEKCSSFKEVDD